jgi:hypothetical protein
MYPVNRLHTACRIERNPKIRNVNVLKETYKKLPPLCKGYVQHLLIGTAQGHFCHLLVVQVTIIDTPSPQKNKNKGFIGWEICFFKDEALFHLSGHINSKQSTTWNAENPQTVQPGYNDIGLYDSPYITSGILCYQLIPHC